MQHVSLLAACRPKRESSAPCGLPTRGVEKIVFEGRPESRRSSGTRRISTSSSRTLARMSLRSSASSPNRIRRGPRWPCQKYLDGALDALWAAAPTLRSLATRCANPAARDFVHLDVPQLLKHLLGLRRRAGARGHLLYLYCDVPGRSGVKHLDDNLALRGCGCTRRCSLRLGVVSGAAPQTCGTATRPR